MPPVLEFLKKYSAVLAVGFIFTLQSLFLLFLYLEISNLKRLAETIPFSIAPTSSPLPSPTPRPTLREILKERFSPPATPSAEKAAGCPAICPAGPAGPPGSPGEKGEKGELGAGSEGRWVTYCQSKLGPIRQKPSYGCDTGNANADYKESEFQLWVR